MGAFSGAIRADMDRWSPSLRQQRAKSSQEGRQVGSAPQSSYITHEVEGSDRMQTCNEAGVPRDLRHFGGARLHPDIECRNGIGEISGWIESSQHSWFSEK